MGNKPRSQEDEMRQPIKNIPIEPYLPIKQSSEEKTSETLRNDNLMKDMGHSPSPAWQEAERQTFRQKNATTFPEFEDYLIERIEAARAEIEKENDIVPKDHELTRSLNRGADLGVQEERERIIKLIEGMKPIMWNDCIEKHKKNITTYETLELVLSKLQE